VQERQPPAAILLDQRERRAGHFASRNAQTVREPADKRGLPCAKITREEQRRAGGERRRQIAADRRRFCFGMCRDGPDHYGWVSAAFRRAVSSRIARPMWVARSPDVMAASPS